MIKEVEGDILLSKAQAIAHGIAPNDDFKQGLALSLRERWPDLYRDFRHYCHTHHPECGDVWLWESVGNFKCYSLMTQEPAPNKSGHPGKATIENVNHCLRNLHKEIEKKGLKTLAITKISTGVGGLDWSEVRPLIDKQFAKDNNVTLYIYTRYVKDAVAHEN